MNVQELIQLIESRYHCMVGPARAYFELPLRDINLWARFVYESIGYSTEGTGPAVEEELCRALLNRFPITEDNKSICLFWRRNPPIEISSENGRTKISTRLIIPGYSIGNWIPGDPIPRTPL